ncbi:MAG: Sua5/YciO/YrdC/YwlC family protein [Candidatus Cloacimonetes bacterium]|nr:Sua5/YciO/YrdC/YwlC family protein [Candidatus Cloacimonadota bacterium]
MKIYDKISKVKYFEDAVFLHHTGSMFGVGCSAFSEVAVKKIDILKKRNQGKGYIVLIPEIDWLERYKIRYHPKIRRLLQQYWPGELSIILNDPEDKFKLVSQNQKVAFRIPTSSFLREFIKKIDKPIVSTSINLSEEVPYKKVKDIIDQKSDWFDFAVIPGDIKAQSSVPSTVIDCTDAKLTCIREGKITFDNIKRSFENPQILFICTANICRSPMAEFYLKTLIQKNKLSFCVKSAGFLNGGRQISENSEKVLKENEIDASKHISTQINEELILDSWLVLTMTIQHKLYLLDYFPNIENKVFTLSEFTGYQIDVDDPYGLEIYFYRETYEKIRERIDNLLDKISREE